VCESGYSLYFPCIKNVTRGENTCFEFYVVDNVEKQEVDLRDVNDITLNMSGRYNCNFGSYSYPEHIKYIQYEDFSVNLYDTDLSDIIIHNVDMYIDEVDEYYNVISSFILGSENFRLCIDGVVGKFLEGSEKYGVLDLVANDTSDYIFLGWYVEENDECESGNKYDRLIKSNRLTFNVTDDFVIRAVYRKRKTYDIKISPDNVNSTFVVYYMNRTTNLNSDQYVKVLEGHDVKLRCLPYEIYTSDNQIKPSKFLKWDDGFESPIRVLKVGGDNQTIYLKAYCLYNEEIVEDVTYIDNIDPYELNKFSVLNPYNRKELFIDSYFFDNIYVRDCDIISVDGVSHIFLYRGGYIQIVNISETGRLRISLGVKSGKCRLYVGDIEILPTDDTNNIFIFDYNGEEIIIKGDGLYVSGLSLSKEVIYDKGKCRFCLNSDETLKLQPGEITVDGGVVVNENPYGISPVKIANVTTITPLKINI
jgi:hypothetical protein